MTGADPGTPARGRRPEAPAGPSLSPSRAADFKTCPLLFRFRSVDKLPETPSADQVRGTLVHAVLERLFDLPAADRTPEAAAALVLPEWERLRADEPLMAEIFATEPDEIPRRRAPAVVATKGDTSESGQVSPSADPALPATAGATDSIVADFGTATDSGTAAAVTEGQLALVDAPAGAAEAARIAAFLSSARDLLGGYFAVEDPRRLEPAERETYISTLIDDELLLRGYIDRLDVSPAGDLRVVDYKTGGAPREAFEGRALFQLKFYALVLWRTRGVVPRVLRLVYLKDAEVLDYSPEAGELERFERTLVALSQAIERAKRNQDFRPKPSRLCGWCSHQALCPEFGGTPPAYPASLPLLTVSESSTRVRTDPVD
ncbi:RecB family exonuclease [Actinoplanes rectilineatus]|uniref:RecB family exonuclease n=1 Tax=Actinoplanes rectilineatus TaxID=113571 RepID=UPI0005F290F8|nr:PD-(D/E)XK nuclease family protein [Actinoplanes rectilineatus]